MKKKILVVEDDKFLLKVYKRKLTQEGFDVDIAEDGEEGLKKMLHYKPDLVLLDLVMPRMNGFDFLSAVRRNDEIKDTKVVVLSNLGQEEDIAIGKKLGVLEYIVKSNVKIDDVVKTIKKYV